MQSAIDLIYTIGDAASQGDSYGQWLRQNVSGVDFSGLVPASPVGGASQGQKSPGPTGGGTLPPVPLPPLPLPLPPLPGLPPVGGSNGTSGGGGGILPTPSVTAPAGIHLLVYTDQWLADYGAWGDA
jgi:hypothetical protein